MDTSFSSSIVKLLPYFAKITVLQFDCKSQSFSWRQQFERIKVAIFSLSLLPLGVKAEVC
jgi:hypothetical protein